VTALDRAQKNQLGQGKLATLDNQIDTTDRHGQLRAVFDNEDEALFPNQFVNIRLLADTVRTPPPCRWRRSSAASPAPSSTWSRPTTRWRSGSSRSA
jgi:hypothetical protein